MAVFTILVWLVYRKMHGQMQIDLQVQTYPLLSQFLEWDMFTQDEITNYPSVARPSILGYRLNIRNFGKGPAIDQSTRAVYLPTAKEIGTLGRGRWVKDFGIIQAHNKIRPGGRRPLNLTILSRLDRRAELEPQNVFWGTLESLQGELWIQTKCRDLMGREYCVCSKYERVTGTDRIKGEERRRFPKPLSREFPGDGKCGGCPFA